MSQTTAPVGDLPGERSVGLSAGDEIGERAVAPHAHHSARVRHFLWHLAEMVGAMMIGMFVGIGAFLAVLGENGDAAQDDHPAAFLAVMAVGMAVPMVAWMRFRRHTWRNSVEMGAAMLLPALPFLACIWADLAHDGLNGPYMLVSTLAMIGHMLYRWNVYSTHPGKLRSPKALVVDR